jgi:thiol:disulfide interchange protein DsbD
MKILAAPVLLLLAFVPGAVAAGGGDGDPFAALKGLVGGKKEFLEPDRAFLFNAEAKDAHTLTAQWEVAEGYYLYHDKFTFKVDTEGVTLGAVSMPRGEMKDDEYFGKVEIMHGSFAVELPLVVAAGATAPSEVSLTVGYQGCAEDGICYPPITKTVPIALKMQEATPPPQSSTDAGGGTPLVSETDRFTGLLSGGLSGGMLAAFFGVGLLLALTPCVFPMVPILSGILVGQRQTVTAARGFLLSSVYVVAMALTYAVAGVLAGLFGQNLQAWFQQPAVLVGFALVFVVLALSMFGLYELQLPGSWQSRLTHLSQRQRVGSLGGVAVMGVLSAVIVGPCVAPPLAGALVYIGQSGDAWLGGAALFAMAMGMGTPLLAVGASAGHLLPRAGAWMETVKKFFGVLMLAVAVWFLSRILPGAATLALYALVAVIAATLLGAFHSLDAGSSGLRRFGKGLGWAACVYGAALLLGAMRGNDDPLQPLAHFGGTPESALADAGAPSTPRELAFTPVRGAEGLRAALQAAGGKPVLLDFYADWCVECKKLEKETFTDAEVRAALDDAVLLRADVTANDEIDQELLRQLGLFGPPAILFFDSKGQERRPYRLQGFVGPEPFVKHLDTAIGRCGAPGQTYC